MIAFDFPPNDIIAVEYVGLSHSSSAAEFQKDILRRVLSEILPNAGEIVDSSEAPQRNSADGVFVRCLQCDVKAELSQFSLRVQEDDRFKHLPNLSKSQFKIQIASPAQQINWTIEIGRRKLAWYPAMKADMLPSGGTLSAQNFVTLSCIEGVNCPKTQIYVTQDESNKRIKQWVGRRIDVASTNFFGSKTDFVVAEKIPFISEVKAQSLVRALVTSRNSTLSIKTNAKALKNGGIGDTIPVEIQAAAGSLQKSKLLDARVTGEGEVEIVR